MTFRFQMAFERGEVCFEIHSHVLDGIHASWGENWFCTAGGK